MKTPADLEALKFGEDVTAPVPVSSLASLFLRMEAAAIGAEPVAEGLLLVPVAAAAAPPNVIVGATDRTDPDITPARSASVASNGADDTLRAEGRAPGGPEDAQQCIVS